MGKKRVNKYPTAFRKMALERLKNCRSVTELSAELGIHRTQLYKWRDQMEPVEDGQGPPANSRERALRKEIRELKRQAQQRPYVLPYKTPVKRRGFTCQRVRFLSG